MKGATPPRFKFYFRPGKLPEVIRELSPFPLCFIIARRNFINVWDAVGFEKFLKVRSFREIMMRFSTNFRAKLHMNEQTQHCIVKRPHTVLISFHASHKFGNVSPPLPFPRILRNFIVSSNVECIIRNPGIGLAQTHSLSPLPFKLPIPSNDA